MNRFKGVAVGVVVPAVLVLSAGVAQASALRGTVVHRNTRAHSFVVVDSSGRMSAVHSSRAVRVGSVVVVSVRLLHNGTFASRSVRITGRRSRAHASGVVTHVDRARGSFTLSSPGVSMLVHRARRGATHAADSLPAVGATVSVSGNLDDRGELEAQSVSEGGTQTSGIELEGSVLSLDTTARRLSLSADDNSQSGQAILVTVPVSIDLGAFSAGQEVKLRATLQPDGTYLLEGSSSDQGSRGADNKGDQQGTGGGDQSGTGGGDHSGGGSDNTPSGSSPGSGSSSAPSPPGSDG